MTPLQLPQAKLKLTRKEGVIYVFCPIRRKKLVLTPEEWVRQHLIHYLIDYQSVSIGKIGSEVSLNYNGLNKRADLIIVNEFGHPEVIIECKAPEIQLSEATLFQIATYYQAISAKILVLSNGLQHYVWNVETQEESHELNELTRFFEAS